MSFAPLLLSLQVATIAVVLATVGGVAIGATLATKRFWGRDAVDVILTTPMILPPTVLGYYLLSALGRTSVIGRAYEAVVGDTIVFTKVGAVIAATIGALPLVAKAARSAVEGVDPTLVAAARTLGATPWRALSTIVLPLASRGILGGVMLGFARAGRLRRHAHDRRRHSRRDADGVARDLRRDPGRARCAGRGNGRGAHGDLGRRAVCGRQARGAS